MKTDEQEQWLAQWRAASIALRQQKVKELAGLSEVEAHQATRSLLLLAGQIRPGHPRWNTSGLVEQQRWFHRLPLAELKEDPDIVKRLRQLADDYQ